MRTAGGSCCGALVLAAILAGCGTSRPAAEPPPGAGPPSSRQRLEGFEISPHFGEQIRRYRVEPEVSVHVNAPAAFDFDKPTRLILYALPNGNTTAQTIGCQPRAGLDWHYNIQHIGAQTRRLREVIADENIVIAYLEADGRAWPSWKRRHEDYRVLIPRVVRSVRDQLPGPPAAIDLSGHSGGGSFILGYIDAAEAIPPEVRRIEFLDSNYGYSDEAGHGDKLVAWLKARPDHCLSVICYDDREIELDGRKVVGPTGGTWRPTLRLLERLRKDFDLAEAPAKEAHRYRGLEGRIDVIMHPNPQNRILHTALVGEMNGFIHASTSGTRHENVAGVFNGGVAYARWIQDGE
ncbi:MAG: hypothetical protein AMXMBFR83_21720 [Phycisphaerae bacterium]